MPHDESVTTWLGKLKDGDETAAQQLWERYFDELVRVARTKLGQASRRVSDEEDVALVAFNSFCKGAQDGRFPRLDDRDDLWQVLLMLTARKAIDQRRVEEADKRGGGDVQGESVFEKMVAETSSAHGIEQIVGETPTPDFALAVSEEMETLLSRLADDELQQIALAKLDGSTNAEVSQRFEISPRSVERKLNLIRRIWSEDPAA